MPVRESGLAYPQFMIYFEDRFAAYCCISQSASSRSSAFPYLDTFLVLLIIWWLLYLYSSFFRTFHSAQTKNLAELLLLCKTLPFFMLLFSSYFYTFLYYNLLISFGFAILCRKSASGNSTSCDLLLV